MDRQKNDVPTDIFIQGHENPLARGQENPLKAFRQGHKNLLARGRQNPLKVSSQGRENPAKNHPLR